MKQTFRFRVNFYPGIQGSIMETKSRKKRYALERVRLEAEGMACGAKFTIQRIRP